MGTQGDFKSTSFIKMGIVTLVQHPQHVNLLQNSILRMNQNHLLRTKSKNKHYTILESFTCKADKRVPMFANPKLVIVMLSLCYA
jgi:hypothetical protein